VSLRGALRVAGRAVVALLLAGTIAALVFHSWLEAQGRTLIVLTRTSNTPVLGWMFGVFTDEPRAEDTVIGGLPMLLVRPGEGRSWPASVFLNGVTRRGRFHPKVQRLAHALARAGYLVAVPDPPGLRDGELSLSTLAGTKAAVRALLARPDVSGRITLFGVSAGGSLALLAAEDPEIAPHVRVVGGLAPYTKLADVVRIVTTGTYVENGMLHRYRSKPFAALVAARSLAAALPSARDRVRVLARLPPITVPENATNLLRPLRELDMARLRPSTRAYVRLLLNRDPQRFDALYRALPASTRAAVERLSPLAGAKRLRAPVLIVSAPHDKYFPPEQTRVLASRASSHVQLTITPALAHAIPHFSLRDAHGVLEFDLFVVRALHAAG
jgi:pimeloyl-ACP methyl ester carboxylesterase